MSIIRTLLSRVFNALDRGVAFSWSSPPGVPPLPDAPPQGDATGFGDEIIPTMTAEQWRTCHDPRWMVRFLTGTTYPRFQDVEAFPHCKASDRKLRLFACACYWRVHHLLPHPLAQACVEKIERIVDGELPASELFHVEAAIRTPLDQLEGPWRASRDAERDAMTPTHEALALAGIIAWDQAPKAAYYALGNAAHALASIQHPRAASYDAPFIGSERSEAYQQADLLRCLFGGLFTSSAAMSMSDHAPARQVALAIYHERTFDQLPILADALEEAGCTDEALLFHLRAPGIHARGCWALDAVLGRS